MKAILWTAVLLVVSVPLWAAEPINKVLFLDNENLFEGEVTRTKEGYLIKLPKGGEISISAERVRHVLPDKAAAYKIMQERANLRDADERIRLAFWCERFGMKEEARFEAETALRMRPGFRRASDFLEWLGPPARSEATKTETKVDPKVTPVKAETVTPLPSKVIEPPAPITYNTESFNTFSSQVNRILVNACYRCHSGKYEGSFKIDATDGRKGMMSNLQNSLRHLDKTKIEKSPLLIYATTAHGGATDAPLRDKQKPAIETLQSWSRWALAPEGTVEPPVITVSFEKPATSQSSDDKDPRKLPPIGETVEIPAPKTPMKDPFVKPATTPISPLTPIGPLAPVGSKTPDGPFGGSNPIKKPRPESPFAEDVPATRDSNIKDSQGKPIQIGQKTSYVPETEVKPTVPDDPDDFANPKKFNGLPKP